MLIIYFDEVKYDGERQKYEWLGGIAVQDHLIREIEYAVGDVAEKCFEDRVLSPNTELHAAEIFHRKRNFKRWSTIDSRIDVLKNLARILSKHELIKRICVRIEVDRLPDGDDPKKRAFVFFVEKANELAKNAKTVGLLIGDFEKERLARESASTLSRFREYGTPYAFGKQIDNLVDTVHFTHSHSSRMLQLADCYVWFMQLCHGAGTSEQPRSDLVQFLRDHADIIWPDKYKFWPTKDSWCYPPKGSR